jgi:serine/threonine protein kinase
VRLDHQNIIKVLNRGELPDGRPYIVMPYVKGETLRSQISRQGMSFDRAASILKQIGAALDHVHANQIFHRDLKPENVMLRRDTDSVVIIDFGIAKVRNSLVAPSTVNGAAIGTLLYMSPEQLRGEQVTAASVIYSMAVVAYEMVTGRLPFNPASPAELLEMQRAGVRVRPLHLRQKLPLQADRLITRALRFDPHRRYQNAADYGDRLAHALLEPLKPSRISNRVKVFASMLILAALAYGLWRYTDRPVHLRTPTRAFTYWLMVQRMRNGHEYQAPFKSNGEDIFESGDKFQLNLFSPEPGYLYVFYERPPQATDNSFVMLYPRSANGGVATLGANQPFQSDWITFQGPAGDENLWIIWSVSPVTQLESAQTEALKHSGEGITGDNLIALKDFLRAAQRESDVMVSHYKAEQKAVARGRGELLITLAQFKHW